MAAEQVCAHLPAFEVEAGSWYLVATLAAIEPDMPRGRLVTDSPFAWVSRVHREGTDWALGEWVPAAGRLDPVCWRGGRSVGQGRR
ncbi:hypothetical protein GFY24_25275 [Nocardia sp. SYP-A9097]|uniref:hypothetical protein n=1 Tax=Nocardia sp. SYP-A9097 TaxID=2663237 RepID=UPI00129A2D89|nr:hypothetical protein [Nocardia sp. SYP-A9097]MRH90712.1 hypothetical protein [Nocardia sp. SYP-A9097]